MKVPLETGTILFGKYRVEEKKGEGSFGVVYRAVHLTLNTEHALKVLWRKQKGMSEDEFAKRAKYFRLEAQLGAQIKNPHVITVHDFYEIPEDGQPSMFILVMDYADGGTLRDTIEDARRANAPLPVGKVVDIALQLVEGLSAFHRHAAQPVHRDLKPGNLLWVKGKLVIADLGVAQVKLDLTQRLDLTAPLPHPGTLAYMSPQQANDRRPVKPADDLYAVGCVLFELLTLKKYQGEKDELQPHPRVYRHDVPAWLDAIVARCLEPEREQRFQRAEDLLESLQTRRLVWREAGAAGEAEPEPPMLPHKIQPPLYLSETVRLEWPTDLAFVPPDAWPALVEAFRRGELTTWFREAVLPVLKFNLPMKWKVESLLQQWETFHAEEADADRLAVSRKLVTVLREIKGYRPPVLAIAPLGLGMVEIGATTEGVLRVSNTGGSVLEIRVRSLHPALEVEGGETLHALQGGETVEIPLRLTPDKAFLAEEPPVMALQVESNVGTEEVTAVYRVHRPVLHVERLDFGEVEEGRTAKRVLRVSNTGGSVLEFRARSLHPALEVEGSNALHTVRGGEVVEIPLRLTPDEAFLADEPPEIALQVESNVGSQEIRVAYHIYRPPRLEIVTKGGLDFGRVQPGKGATCTLQIRNAGDKVLQGEVRGSHPTLRVVDGKERFTCAAGETARIRLSLTPTQAFRPGIGLPLTVNVRSNGGAAIVPVRYRPALPPLKRITPPRAETLEVVARLGKGTMNVMAWSPDGKQWAVGSSIGVYLYDAATGQQTAFWETNTWVTSVAFSPTGVQLASGATDGTVRLWRVSDGSLVRTLEGHEYGVSSVVFSPDGTLLASGSGDRTVKLWRISDGALVRTLEGHTDGVRSVAFSPDGALLASGSGDRTVKLWRVSDGALVRTLEGHTENVHRGVLSVAFSPDGTLLASGSENRTVKLWRVSDGTWVRTLKGHTDSVTSVAFSPDGQLVASLGGHGTVQLWRVSDGTLVHTLEGHTGWANSVVFSPNGLLLAFVEGVWGNGTVKLWRVSDGTLVRTLKGHTARVRSVVFSPDGLLLASAEERGAGNGAVKLWRVSDGMLVRDLSWAGSVAFSPDGALLALGETGVLGTVKLLRASDGALVRTLEGHTGWANSVNSVVFSPDGALLALGETGVLGTVKLLRASDGALARTLEGHTGWANSVVFSPNGALLASGKGMEKNGTVELWRVSDGALVRTLEGHTSGVWSVAFSPDGTLLASGSLDKTVRLWRVSDGALVRTLEGHTGEVGSVAFSLDGALVVSGANDETVRLWRVSDGQLLCTLEGHTGGVTSVAFSPDGTLLASGSSDGTIRLWGIPE